MSLYKNYLKERENLEIIEKPYGFATYRFRGIDCYLQDIYILPALRNKKLASKLADEVCEIAKKSGYFILTGSVDDRANGAIDSHKVLRSYKMTPYVKEGFVTYYKKGI